MLHQIKAHQFYNDLALLSTVLSPTEKSRIQGLFKAFDLSDFPVLSKAHLIFKDLQDSLVYSCTFHACVNPVDDKNNIHSPFSR